VILLLSLLACVPKARFEDQLARSTTLSAELTEAEAAIKAMRAEAESLASSLEAERQMNAELTTLTETLDAQTTAQAEQLVKLSEKVADLKAVNSAQKAAKSDLESLVGELQSAAGEAQSEAEKAREKAARLAADRERLAAEREALAAEAQRLAEEKKALEAKTAEYDALVGELQSEIDAGQITITELSGKLTVAMSNAILFSSGATTVKPAGKEALAKVAGVLADVRDREVRVEGHTDNVPVGAGAPYPDNWALSALRASTVVNLLIEGGVDPLNVAAVGYGEHHPTASNDTREGRAANRRTEIVLVPKLDPKSTSGDAVAE
jgi:chemotaxis protein MotB